MPQISKDFLQQVRRHFRYESATGRLFWVDRPNDDFADGKYDRQRIAAMWRSKYLGKEAFCCLNGSYRRGPYYGRQWRAHHIVWLLFNDTLPAQLDHINGDTHDNRIENLRAASALENARNRKIGATNKSGVMGVWMDSAGKWRSQIGSGGSRQFLGVFQTKEAAAAARAEAERALNYHPNHGRKTA